MGEESRWTVPEGSVVQDSARRVRPYPAAWIHGSVVSALATALAWWWFSSARVWFVETPIATAHREAATAPWVVLAFVAGLMCMGVTARIHGFGRPFGVAALSLVAMLGLVVAVTWRYEQPIGGWWLVGCGLAGGLVGAIPRVGTWTAVLALVVVCVAGARLRWGLPVIPLGPEVLDGYLASCFAAVGLGANVGQWPWLWRLGRADRKRGASSPDGIW